MKKIALCLTLLNLGLSLFSLSEVKLKLDRPSYELGDILSVDLWINSDKEFNHVFTDINYDSEVLEYLDHREGELLTSNRGKVLYATNRGRTILSILWDSNIKIYNESRLLTLNFKVKKSAKESQLKFNSSGVKSVVNNIGVDIESTFIDSSLFTVNEIDDDSYIWIKSPSDGSILSKKELFTILFSKGEGYGVKLRNDSVKNSSVQFYNINNGYLENIELDLVEGENIITALLYKDGRVVKMDSTTIKYLRNSYDLFIEAPLESSVVSQNRITVKAASRYSFVTVNGERAYSSGFKNSEGLEVYFRDVWLKPGFNTIHVEAFTEDNFTISKSISVYYEKRDEIFRINTPKEMGIIKWTKDAKLTFTGEITNKYSSSGSLNDIRYKLIFYPVDGGGRGIPIQGDRNDQCIIENATTMDRTESPFLFKNREPINIGELGAGRLEIIINKNKVEREIRRTLRIDDSKHEIIIDQPIIYNEDNLNNRRKIDEFHKISKASEIIEDNIEVSNSGEIKIARTDTVLSVSPTDEWINYPNGLIEKESGDLIYYTNKNGIARILSRSSGSNKWESYYKDSDQFYLYDIKESSRGLLLGVSNYNSTGDSGLFLLKDNRLINILIGEPIPHVQFIRLIGDRVYLYGNLYSHLYSFNINNLELDENGMLTTSIVDKVYLENHHSLKDFNISQSGNSAALLTTDKKLLVYNLKNGNSYKLESSLKGAFDNVDSITPGYYENSSYNSWLIQGKTDLGETSLYTIMERKDSGELKIVNLETSDIGSGKVLSHGFSKDSYNFLFEDAGKYKIIKGKIFFNNFEKESENDFRLIDELTLLEESDQKLIVTRYNGTFWGEGYNKPLYNFRNRIRERGNIAFSYKNVDAIGYKGLSFTIPSIWLDQDNLNFKIDINDTLNNFTIDSAAFTTINSWFKANRENSFYTPYLVYNSLTKKYTLDIDFKKLSRDSSIDFNYIFKAKGDLSPVVSELKVKKKIPLKLPTNNNRALLTIKGRVSDPTVEYITSSILSSKQAVDSRGSFIFDTTINGFNKDRDIEISAVNSVGERTCENLKVILFDSVLGIKKLFFSVAKAYKEYKTDHETVGVNFDYYGLKGAVLGYEIISINNDVVIKRGLLNSVIDETFNSSIYSEDSSNLESGRVVDGKIKLVPGAQRVRIFVENPGGKREYYAEDDGSLPRFIYDLDEDKQKIIFTNNGFKGLKLPETYSGTKVEQEMNVEITESNFKYQKKLFLSGEIESLQKVSDLRIESSSSDITFDNGKSDDLILVDELNRFNFNINIDLDESNILERPYYITVQPTAPYLSHLKSVVKFNIKKEYSGAVIVPDFTQMDDSFWSLEDKKFLKKAIRLKFERILPPDPSIELIVNFDKKVKGKLEKVPGTTNLYKVVDSTGLEKELIGAKFGVNRVRWTLYTGEKLVSASIMSNQYMRDFVFTLTGISTFTPTTVTTPLVEETYYSNEDAPVISIIKDSSTNLTMILNGEKRPLDSSITEIDLKTVGLLEGVNHLRIESDREELDINYRILFDSIDPVIGEVFYRVDDDNNISYLGVHITEANIDKVKLILKDHLTGNETQITTIDYNVDPLSNELYRITWPGIDSIHPRLNPYLTNNPFKIIVIDKAKRDNATSFLKGPEKGEVNPFGTIEILDNSGPFKYYKPSDIDLEFRIKNDPFDKESWVIYDSSVTVDSEEFFDKNNKDISDRILRISRPGNITLNKTTIDISKTDSIEVRSGTSIKLGKGFSLPSGKTLKLYPKSTYPEAINPEIQLKSDDEYKEFSLCFQLKVDDYGLFRDYIPNNDDKKLKKIVTLSNTTAGDNDAFLGYMYSDKGIALFVETDDPRDAHYIPLDRVVDPGSWNTVLLSVSRNSDAGDILTVYINDTIPVSMHLDSILPKGSSIYFGDKAKDDNGHFTITSPFIVDRVISSGDLPAYIEKFDKLFAHELPPVISSTALYTFDNQNEFGEEAYKLRGHNYVLSDREDANYAATGSALVASNYHKNYIDVKYSSIIFNDCQMPIINNLGPISYDSAEGLINLEPREGKTGRYTFGNRPTNHGINNNNYYTISGQIERVNPPEDDSGFIANLVVIINNSKKVFPLYGGEFSYVYEHNTANPPETVIVFIETNREINLYDNFQFVEGNAALNGDTLINTPSLVSTIFYFLNTFTMELAYKPFNVNPLGLVNYNGVIVHSTHGNIEIYTEYNSSLGASEYKAIVGGQLIDSGLPVTEGWHKLLVTYSKLDGVARFYIDDQLVGEANGTISIPDTNNLKSDNLFIGGDPENRSYGSGYIDNVKITNLFNNTTPLIKDVEFSYNEEASATNLDLFGNSYILTSGKWKGEIREVLPTNKLKSPLKQEFDNKDTLPINIRDIVEPAKYFVRLKGEYNNKRVNSIFHFVKDDKPNFKVVSAPKLIIAGEETSLNFKVHYDNSHLVNKVNTNRYGAFIIEVNEDNSSKKERILLWQDIETKPDNKWIVKRVGDETETVVSIKNGSLDLFFPSQVWNSVVNYRYDSFYFFNSFNETYYSSEDYLVGISNKIIPMASLDEIVIAKEPTFGKEYKLGVRLKNAVDGEGFPNIDKFKITYEVVGYKPPVEVSFNNYGTIDLFYDDMLKDLSYNINGEKYQIKIVLIYEKSSFQEKVKDISWEEILLEEKEIEKKSSLTIKSLDLLCIKEDLDRVTGDPVNKGTLFANIDYVNSGDYNPEIGVALNYKVTIFNSLNGVVYNGEDTPITDLTNLIIKDVLLGAGNNRVVVEVFDKDNKEVRDSSSITVTTSSEAPTLFFTNTYPYYLPYNNLGFTWDGRYKDLFNDSILYTYNLDNQGWSSQLPNRKKLDLYSVDEGFHTLRVKAIYNNRESSEIISRFFIDTIAPEINLSKINILPKRDLDGIIYSIVISGDKGALADSSLDKFYINGVMTDFNEDGEFYTQIEINKEGTTNIGFEAVDRVGNRTIVHEVVDNSFIEIISPSGNYVEYSPLTIVGKISSTITQDIELFIEDPLYKGVWHEANINSDRVFFIDNLKVNPGSSTREAVTSFRLKATTTKGKTYYKELEYKAGDLYRPLQIVLSKQSTQGEGKPIEVDISATCRADISSWSIDFDGDGIYDDIDLIDGVSSFEKVWSHSYSSIGEVHPRVRVITKDGDYFTDTKTLVIHEEINAASSTVITAPIDMGVSYNIDKSNKVFVLSGMGKEQKVDLFEIGSTYNYFSNKLYSVSLDGYIEGRAKTITVIDSESFIVTATDNGISTIYHFIMNEFGNFVVASSYKLDEEIKSITASKKNLIFTFKNSSNISLIKLDFGKLDFTTINTKELRLPVGNMLLPRGCDITYSKGIIYVADYLRQYIVEFNEDIVAINYWGGFGYSDGKFISPEKMTKYGNRLFIYDGKRVNIQAFRPDNSIITSLDSTGDYLPEGFLNNISSVKSIGREEGGRLYYYLIALSLESETLSLIRLPGWEELRAKVRNNKIAFVKDKEIYTAKPDGSDIRKVLSTDSLPRVEGAVDYPTISPDGRWLSFISRDRIFTGELSNTPVEETYSYDNLYIMEIGGVRPTRIPLSTIDGYEIERPVFNSNGDTIAFSGRKSGGFWQIYEYSIKDGTISKLFDSKENLRFPFYSPDDRFIVYTTDYDGDEDIEIYDKNNPDLRIEVTSNDFRDSYPVWSRVYPFEISNPESKIESKIAYVSDRGFKKGVHYSYISHISENDIRVVHKDMDKDVGDDPDSASIAITTDTEGDYPAFTGDGTKVVFENYDGYTQDLTQWDYTSKKAEKMKLPEGSQRPSGMRNSITGFDGRLINGNEVQLSWKPYTDHKTFYFLQFKKAVDSLNFTQKKIYSQDGTVVSGLDMNTEYLMRVIIEENEEMVANTKWLKIKVPEVAARPSYRIDDDNPYLVHFHAWKPEEDTNWSFSWIIDNQEVDSAKTSQDFSYQFGTSGEKSIQLRATNREGDFSNISKPITIDIHSDIKPVIEYSIIKTPSGGIVLDLDCRNSIGKRINYSTASWTITGAGGQTRNSNVTNPSLDVSDFSGRVNVNLKLSRQEVYGRLETDILEVSRLIDLTYDDLKPVITYIESDENKRLIEFDGTSSLGNIDWTTARWAIFSDGNAIQSAHGVSSISYLFPETSKSGTYAASLTVTDSSSGLTKTTSQLISVDPSPIEPVITSEIISLKDKEGNDIGVKVVLTATSSKGSSIDYSLSEWNIPVASQYGDQPKQRGATAVFNLANPGDRNSIDVSLTLYRRGGVDAVTRTETILIGARNVTETEIMVNAVTEETPDGNIIIMDVLKSKGTDIDWANTTWLVNNHYSFKGPTVRLDRSHSINSQVITYSVTLYRFSGKPITVLSELAIDPYHIKPVISEEIADDGDGSTYKLSITGTSGVNIDWDRTLWSIWDGNEDVVQKRGASIIHKFIPKDQALGYPVLAELYFKGSETPFYAYKSINIDGDEITPIIQWDKGIKDYSSETEDKGDTQVISFSALSSTGSGIDWSQAMWNFGDGSAPAYGSTVQHKYPVSGSDNKYNVSLTLNRNSRNGNKESKTVYKTIEIGRDEIDPVITARIDPRSNTLVLSAEASEGRGLLLDRSVWVFPGKGESENFSRSRSSVQSDSYSESLTVGVNSGWSISDGVGSVSFGSNLSGTISDSDSSSDSKNNNESYSTQNIHTGAICRRFVEDFNYDDYSVEGEEERMIWVTLFVYRLNSDGSMTGSSITQRVNIDRVKEASKIGKIIELR